MMSHGDEVQFKLGHSVEEKSIAAIASYSLESFPISGFLWEIMASPVNSQYLVRYPQSLGKVGALSSMFAGYLL
jgi:hypothetical protein